MTGGGRFLSGERGARVAGEPLLTDSGGSLDTKVNLSLTKHTAGAEG